MKWIIGLIALILVFGCLGWGEQPPVENVNDTAIDNNQNTGNGTTVIINPQQNQTIEQNGTDDDPPVEPPTIEMDYDENPTANIGIYFIDVGDDETHGDAILIKKGDFDVLVDAGPESNGGKVVDFLRSKSVDDLELVISTNADPRHYGGLDRVADNYKIDHFWWSGDSFNDAEYLAVVNKIKGMSKVTTVVERGFSADYNGISFEILNPQSDRFENINNDAIVIRVADRGVCTLITSGIQQGAREKLINEQTSKTQCEVIQAPYYGVGEGNRNIALFLVKAEPEAMIITGSSNDGPENGGSREPLLRLLEQYDIDAYKTYESGTIRITSDGSSYAIQGLGG